MKTRYLVMVKRGADFREDVIAAHIAFLDHLRGEGYLEMTGGFSDKSGGAYLLQQVDSLAQAQAIVARDPLSLTGTCTLTLHEWNTR